MTTPLSFKFESLSVATEGMDDSLTLMKFLEEDLILLPEKDILGPVEEPGDESKRKGVRELKHLLRGILCFLPICRNLKNSNLADVLRAESMVTFFPFAPWGENC